MKLHAWLHFHIKQSPLQNRDTKTPTRKDDSKTYLKIKNTTSTTYLTKNYLSKEESNRTMETKPSPST